MPEKPQTYLEIHIDNWRKRACSKELLKKTALNKGNSITWNNNLDASGRPLYDHNGKLSRHKRQGPIQAKTDWDPLK